MKSGKYKRNKILRRTKSKAEVILEPHNFVQSFSPHTSVSDEPHKPFLANSSTLLTEVQANNNSVIYRSVSNEMEGVSFSIQLASVCARAMRLRNNKLLRA
jgi:hypothetical protein